MNEHDWPENEYESKKKPRCRIFSVDNGDDTPRFRSAADETFWRGYDRRQTPHYVINYTTRWLTCTKKRLRSQRSHRLRSIYLATLFRLTKLLSSLFVSCIGMCVTSQKNIQLFFICNRNSIYCTSDVWIERDGNSLVQTNEHVDVPRLVSLNRTLIGNSCLKCYRPNRK